MWFNGRVLAFAYEALGLVSSTVKRWFGLHLFPCWSVTILSISHEPIPIGSWKRNCCLLTIATDVLRICSQKKSACLEPRSHGWQLSQLEGRRAGAQGQNTSLILLKLWAHSTPHSLKEGWVWWAERRISALARITETSEVDLWSQEKCGDPSMYPSLLSSVSPYLSY